MLVHKYVAGMEISMNKSMNKDLLTEHLKKQICNLGDKIQILQQFSFNLLTSVGSSPNFWISLVLLILTPSKNSIVRMRLLECDLKRLYLVVWYWKLFFYPKYFWNFHICIQGRICSLKILWKSFCIRSFLNEIQFLFNVFFEFSNQPVKFVTREKLDSFQISIFFFS